jgi:formate-dependent nitrite reductase membrane component NrfD
MNQTKPYEFMVRLTQQKEWVEGRGVLLCLAFFISEAGAGLYFTSLIFNSWWGLVWGWVMIFLLGGGLHLAYLGKPFRAWRIMLHPGRSEMSRGLLLMGVMGILGLVQISAGTGVVELSSLTSSVFFKIIMGILALTVILHGFMTLNTIGSISVWNSAILIPLSIASGMWVGMNLLVLVMIFSAAGHPPAWGEIFLQWSLIIYGLMIIFLLMDLGHKSPKDRYSLRRLLVKDMTGLFYGVFLVVGILVPGLIILLSLLGDAPISNPFIFVRALGALVGDFVLRYLIFKAGLYDPLV